MKHPNAKSLRTSARLAILLFALLFLALTAYQIYKILGPQEEVSVTLYNYLISSDCGYQVLLKKNELFPQGVLEENKLYSPSLVDRTEITFRAEYAGSGKAAVTCDYAIEAVLQGYQGNAETRQTVYEKRYPLKKQTSAEGDTVLKISEPVSVVLPPYKEYVDKANAILGTQIPADLRIEMSGVFRADSEFGKVEKPFQYALSIPLGNNLYTIAKPSPVSIQDAITGTGIDTTEPTPLSFLPAALLFLLAAGVFAFFLFFTRKPTVEEQRRMDIRKLIRVHGSRMIRLTQLPYFDSDDIRQILVADPDSLVKLSDDLQRPISYCPDEEGLPKGDLLFLTENDRCYLLNLNPDAQKNRHTHSHADHRTEPPARVWDTHRLP